MDGGEVLATEPRRAVRAATLALLVGCQFVIILDGSIVNVALPSIQRSFHIPQGGVQEIVTVYAVAFGGPLILGGRVADLVGRRRVFRAGLIGFGAMSLLCGAATSSGVLITARALQGLCAALLAPSALGLLMSTFGEGPARVHALSRFGAATTLGSLSGLVFGGTLVTLAGWRSVFLVNAPIIAVMVAMAGVLLRADDDRAAAPRSITPKSLRGLLGAFDVAGAVLVTLGLSCLVLSLNVGSVHGWSSTECLTLLAGGLFLLAGFVATETRAERPLLRFELFKINTVRTGNALVFLFGLSVGASGLILALYFQDVRHYSPLLAGLAMVPQGVVSYLASRTSGRLFKRYRLRRVLTFSYAMTGLAFGIESLLLSTTRAYWFLLLCFVLLGSVQIICTIGATIASSTGVPRDDLGVAGAVRQTSFQVGFSLGVAVFASIAATWTHRLVSQGIRQPVAVDGGYRVAIAALLGVNVVGSAVALWGFRAYQGQPAAEVAVTVSRT